MKAKTLQIHWHDRQPIFSIDFEPCGKGRLATAGGDENVRVCFFHILLKINKNQYNLYIEMNLLK